MDQLDFEKLYGTFVEESAEQLETMEQDILVLEKDAGDRNALEEIFRMAHSLKGSASLIGFEKMTKLTHALEDMLQKVRDNVLKIDSDMVDLLFKSLDMLRLLKGSIKGQKEADNIDPEELIEQIEKLIAPDRNEEVNSIVKDGSSSIDFNISDNDNALIEEALRSNKHVYMIKIDIDKDAIMKTIKAFLIVNNLKGIGDVITVTPEDYMSISDDDFGTTCLIILATTENVESVKEQIEVVSEINHINISEYKDTEVKKNSTAEKYQAKAADSAQNSIDLRQEKRNTIRVDVRKLDKLMSLAGELVIDKERIMQLVVKLKHKYSHDKDVQDLFAAMPHMNFIGDEIQESIMSVRMYTVENVFDRFPRMIRDLAHNSGKEIDFICEGKETELDRSIIEEIVDPIVHLLRNAVDHGIESREERIAKGKNPTGKIELKARQEENNVIIEVSDDGSGIDIEAIKRRALDKGIATKEKLSKLKDNEILEYIFMPGFSTSKIISEISGRGVGMDVVKTNIEKLNGLVEITSEKDIGTKVILKLPLTLAIIQALLIKQGNNKFAVPLTSVIETIRLNNKDIEEQFRHVKKKEMFLWRDTVIPVVRLDRFFDIKNEQTPEKYFAIVLSFSEKRICLLVEKLIGEQQIVIKSLGEYLGKNKIFGDIKGISGATILGDGSFAVILDIPGILKEIKGNSTL